VEPPQELSPTEALQMTAFADKSFIMSSLNTKERALKSPTFAQLSAVA
jgi:hypothetical protein